MTYVNGRRVLLREAMEALEKRHGHSPKKLAALHAFRDNVIDDGMPILARYIHPIIAIQYYANERRVLGNPQRFSQLTPLVEERFAVRDESGATKRFIIEKLVEDRAGSKAKAVLAVLISVELVASLLAVGLKPEVTRTLVNNAPIAGLINLAILHLTYEEIKVGISRRILRMYIKRVGEKNAQPEDFSIIGVAKPALVKVGLRE